MTRAEIAASAYCDDIHSEKHQSFRKGYQQAEKDLALTWEDMRRIVGITNNLVKKIHNISYVYNGEEIYKEILKRFNETR